MKAVVFLTVLAAVSAQRNYGSYGQPGGGFGAGGPIVFPTDRPIIRPIYPGGAGRPTGGVVRPTGGVVHPTGGVVRPTGGVVRPTGGVVRPTGGVVQPTGGVVRPTGGSVPQEIGCFPGATVHGRFGSSEYHFSWCADGGQKYEWGPAIQYCARLGNGWAGVSIEDQAENNFVSQTIATNQLDYIWTSGQRDNFGRFVWASGAPFNPFGWSHTGFTPGVPQPDNRENGAENCLAILNNFYQDGITWHDIACHHTKPIICERSSRLFG